MGSKAIAGYFCNSPSGALVLASFACIAYNLCMQYTIRKVPSSLDAALRRRAREQGKSLNEVAIEALARGAGISGERGRQRDLGDIAGTWQMDRAFDRALASQDTIDRELWK
jgi:plasmid stability protein